MTESVTVLPRFKEQTTPAYSQQSGDLMPNESEPMVKGLFTSMYENKIIVLFIVIVIIIIGIIAYVIYKSDDKKETLKSPPAKAEKTESSNATSQCETQPQSKTDEPKSIPEQKPKKDLLDLLKRGKQEAAQIETKTEDEIMSLMEDSSEETNEEGKKEATE